MSKRAVIFSYTHYKDGQFTKLGGPALALKDYLISNNWDLLCVWQPLPISSTVSLIVERYKAGNKEFTKKIYFPSFGMDRNKEISLLYFWLKIRDIFSFFIPLIYFREVAVFCGVESINSILGVILRKLGVVHRVIYYNLDYGEVRFKNPMMNKIFHFLDLLAAKHANVTWNLSTETSEARVKKSQGKMTISKQVFVPIGIDYFRLSNLRREQSDPKNLVFLGVLAEKTGARLLLPILAAVQKKYSDCNLTIIGDGPEKVAIESEAKKLGINSVKLLGVLGDPEVEYTLCQQGIGLAPYSIDPDSTKRFGDVTKPKMYVNCGLPVIITLGTPTAKVIETNGAGLIAEFSSEDFARKVITLIEDISLYNRLKSGAVKLASTLEWSEVFSRALRESEIL